MEYTTVGSGRLPLSGDLATGGQHVEAFYACLHHTANQRVTDALTTLEGYLDPGGKGEPGT